MSSLFINRFCVIMVGLALSSCNGSLDTNLSNSILSLPSLGSITVQNISHTSYTDYKGKVCPPPSETIELNTLSQSGLTWSIVSSPSQGSASISGSVITYSPNPGYSGSDTIVFKASNGETSTTGVVNITLHGEDYTLTQTNTTFSDLGESMSYDPGNPNHTQKGITEQAVVWDPRNQRFVAFIAYKITTIGGCAAGSWAVGRATSTDGASWTEDADLVLDPNDYPGTCSFSKLAVVYDSNYYHMFLQNLNNAAVKVMDYWRSSDGISWTKITTVHSDASIEFHDAQAVKYNGEFYVGFISKAPTQDLYYVKGSGTSWSTPALIIDTSAFTDWNNVTFTSAKGMKLDMICTNDPSKPNFISLLTLQGAAANYKYGSVTSNDFVTWTSSAHFTPTVITSAKWITKSSLLIHEGDFLLWWAANDLQNAAWKATFYGTTDSSWPSF